MQGIHERLFQIEQEWIAKLVGLALVGALAASATKRADMAAKTVAFKLVEDILQRLLTDLADTTRRQFPVTALLLDIAGLFQYAHQLFQLFNRLVLIIAEQVFHLLAIDGLKIIQAARFLA